MRRALAIAEQAYGPDHPDVAIRLNNLAQLLQATNRGRPSRSFAAARSSIVSANTRGTSIRPCRQGWKTTAGCSTPWRCRRRTSSDGCRRRCRREPLEPFTPEVERLLGLAQSVQAVRRRWTRNTSRTTNPRSGPAARPAHRAASGRTAQARRRIPEHDGCQGLPQWSACGSRCSVRGIVQAGRGPAGESATDFHNLLNRDGCVAGTGRSGTGARCTTAALSELNQHAPYRRSPKVVPHYHLALCQWRLGDRAAAQREAEQSLIAYGQVSSQDPWTADMIAQSQQLLAALEKKQDTAPVAEGRCRRRVGKRPYSISGQRSPGHTAARSADRFSPGKPSRRPGQQRRCSTPLTASIASKASPLSGSCRPASRSPPTSTNYSGRWKRGTRKKARFNRGRFWRTTRTIQYAYAGFADTARVTIVTPYSSSTVRAIRMSSSETCCVSNPAGIRISTVDLRRCSGRQALLRPPLGRFGAFSGKKDSGFGQGFGMDREFATHEVRLAMLSMVVTRSCVISRAQSAISNAPGERRPTGTEPRYAASLRCGPSAHRVVRCGYGMATMPRSANRPLHENAHHVPPR